MDNETLLPDEQNRAEHASSVLQELAEKHKNLKLDLEAKFFAASKSTPKTDNERDEYNEDGE